MPIMGQPVGPEPCFPQPPMQRTVNGPLSRSGLVHAREQERLRMEWDEWYITADQARSIPIEAMTDELRSRINYSQRDWPENRMTMKDALGPLEPGEGEHYSQMGGHSADLFWRPEPGAPTPEQQLRGRRGIDRGER